MVETKQNQPMSDAEWSVCAADALFQTRHFIPQHQKLFLQSLVRGEEKQFYREKLIEIAGIIRNMPKYYEGEAVKTKNKIAHLHYFGPNCDFWIFEMSEDGKDVAQDRVFGYVKFYGEYPEMGAISLPELFNTGKIELDLHWTPKTWGEIAKENDF